MLFEPDEDDTDGDEFNEESKSFEKDLLLQDPHLIPIKVSVSAI